MFPAPLLLGLLCCDTCEGISCPHSWGTLRAEQVRWHGRPLVRLNQDKSNLWFYLNTCLPNLSHQGYIQIEMGKKCSKMNTVLHEEGGKWVRFVRPLMMQGNVFVRAPCAELRPQQALDGWRDVCAHLNTLVTHTRVQFSPGNAQAVTNLISWMR